MKIKVTAEDISNGVPGNPYTCPIALAAKRAGFIGVAVGSCSLDGGGDIIPLPIRARDFISAFDSYAGSDRSDRYPLEPFEFDVPEV